MDNIQKNYDLPFDNLIDPELDEYFEIEDIHNTEMMDSNQAFPPKGSFTNLPADVFSSSNINQMDLLDQYRKFTQYEELENLK